jgi:hypothetical protein
MSRLSAGKVVKVYNGRGDVENRIKEGENTLRWDKTSCQRFEANQARLKMGVLAYNLLHMIRQFYVWGEEVKRAIDWLIKRLIKVGARVSYHARRWYVHVASAFPLAHHYRAVFAAGHHRLPALEISPARGKYAVNLGNSYILGGICAILFISR